MLTRPVCLILLLFVLPGVANGQNPVDEEPLALPLRQDNSSLLTSSAGPLSLLDASQQERWLGQPVHDIRWAPDGSGVYFRWHRDPQPDEDPDHDPWFWVDRQGGRARQLNRTESHSVPSQTPIWSDDTRHACWETNGRLYLWSNGDAEGRLIYAGQRPVRQPRFHELRREIHFQLGEDLYAYRLEGGAILQLTRKVEPPSKRNEASQWLYEEQPRLIGRHAEADRLLRESRSSALLDHPQPPVALPVEKDVIIDQLQVSPDGRWLTFQTQKTSRSQHLTQYLDFATRSGHASAEDARPKVGQAVEESRLGIVPFEATPDPDQLTIVWTSCDGTEGCGDGEIYYGPYWSRDGRTALVQIVSQGHKDRWISELELPAGRTRMLVHEHDPAWLGGPEPIAGYLRPALLEWLSDDRFVFASERTGWSHLYMYEEGAVRALTEGAWEVRRAVLDRARGTWLLAASREHPCDDQLYRMPASGGELQQLTSKPGRHEGWFSPDGERLAVVYGETVQMPDLYLQDAVAGAPSVRVTQSGTSNFRNARLIRPEVVQFQHPDGKPLWAALFKPSRPLPSRPAIIHIHGGGYRQFSHRGWSVYGYANHLGHVNYFVQQGYTVLDFDYRGSAGFGRDYRTAIYRSMGDKDVTGAVAAVEYLVSEQGIDRDRIGIYGISYGGFFTLMALFRHPGVFTAGVANASVTDWAHYNHVWTSRVLNLPFKDAEAYRRSSPIYYAEGLADALLIVHGLIDDNVHFQDSARLVQRLIELGKDFDVMFYPMERHVIQTQSSRFDYLRRLDRFFSAHLLKP